MGSKSRFYLLQRRFVIQHGLCARAVKAGRCNRASVAEARQPSWLTVGVWKKRCSVNWCSCRARTSVYSYEMAMRGG